MLNLLCVNCAVMFKSREAETFVFKVEVKHNENYENKNVESD